MPYTAIIIGILVLGNVILGKLYLSETRHAAAIQAEYDSFKAEQKALGDKAAKEAAAKEALNKAAKEKADADHQATVARLTSTIGKLRADADRARASFLPAAPSASAGADTACFDRPLYLGAYGELVEKLRGLADEGTKAVTDLDNAKEWAQH